MTPWFLTVVMLAGVNLSRLTIHRWRVAVGGSAAATAALVTIAGGADLVWRLPFTVAATAGPVALWGPLCLAGRRGRLLAGLTATAASIAVLFLVEEDRIATSVVWPWIAGGLLLAEPTTRVLRVGLGLVGKSQDMAGPFGRGEAIGVLERWIVMIMIARGDYAAMAFVVAAKALARHKRLDDQDFAEYFLVGTLASLFAAILVAESLRFFTS